MVDMICGTTVCFGSKTQTQTRGLLTIFISFFIFYLHGKYLITKTLTQTKVYRANGPSKGRI